MIPYVDDPDFTLYVGDVRDVLAGLPDESVHCVVTSPPYWGLRDYGTGQWDGGDPDCDHEGDERYYTEKTAAVSSAGAFSEPGEANKERLKKGRWREAGTCRCGAVRQDRQLGLEATPDLYVQNMVAVFREVRRVLRRDGTCWLNIGDSYAGSSKGGAVSEKAWQRLQGDTTVPIYAGGTRPVVPRLESGVSKVPNGLKPKDLVGIPWRLAFALQADGWYLRADIIWSKPNPMPESVTDRPTRAHEYLFLLTRSPRYFYDQEAIREPHSPDGRSVTTRTVANGSHGNYQEFGHEEGRERWPNAGRNRRSVWEIATEPYPDAHFATFPQALVEPCVKAGCPELVCGTCGKPRTRIVEKPASPFDDTRTPGAHTPTSATKPTGARMQAWLDANPAKTVGWSDCGHNNYRPGVVLDPFMGSGTVALVARRLGRRSIGVELNESYAAMCARRLSQLSLLA